MLIYIYIYIANSKSVYVLKQLSHSSHILDQSDLTLLLTIESWSILWLWTLKFPSLDRTFLLSALSLPLSPKNLNFVLWGLVSWTIFILNYFGLSTSFWLHFSPQLRLWDLYGWSLFNSLINTLKYLTCLTSPTCFLTNPSSEWSCGLPSLLSDHVNNNGESGWAVLFHYKALGPGSLFSHFFRRRKKP